VGRRPDDEPTAGAPEPSQGGSFDGGSFEDAVAVVLHGLGPGEVVTYGEVAAEAGRPGAARAVGRILATSDGAYPWWRVVTASGRLVPGHEVEHARRLRAEGVDVADGRVRRPRSGARADRAGRTVRVRSRPDR
jgi:methylated-DNA-protein-cysteine methyltransferase-like protein